MIAIAIADVLYELIVFGAPGLVVGLVVGRAAATIRLPAVVLVLAVASAAAILTWSATACDCGDSGWFAAAVLVASNAVSLTLGLGFGRMLRRRRARDPLGEA